METKVLKNHMVPTTYMNMKDLTDDEKLLAGVLLMSLANAYNVETNANQVREKYKDEQIAMSLEMTAAHAYQSARTIIAKAPEKVRKAVEEVFDSTMAKEKELKGEAPESLH